MDKMTNIKHIVKCNRFIRTKTKMYIIIHKIFFDKSINIYSII